MGRSGEREVEMSEPRGSEPEGRRERPGGVEYERVDQEYMEQRQLQKGAAGYGFARGAMGVWRGFLTGTAIVIEYAIAPAAIVAFIGAYVESLIGFGGPLVYLIFYAIFIGMFMYGTGEALRLMFIITAVAVTAIVVFVIGMIPHFDLANMFNIAPTDAAGARS